VKENNMFNTKSVEIELGERPSSSKRAALARQPMAQFSRPSAKPSSVRGHCCQDRQAGPGLLPADRPLSGKFSAAGRIPGGFFKRERGATEKETLTSRLIDRPIPRSFYNEVSSSPRSCPTTARTSRLLAMIAAVGRPHHLRACPFMGPIGARASG